MREEQYLTEKHYLVCSKGILPKKVKVTSQTSTTFSGHKAATMMDRQLENNFICLGATAFGAGVAAGLAAFAAACCIPGPGWVVAAIIGVAILAAVGIAMYLCKCAASSRIWTLQSPISSVENKPTLLLSSILTCPAQGGTVTPKETFWAAFGSVALNNLLHIANFAFGFLAGRGMGAIGLQGWGAATAASGAGAGTGAAVMTGLRAAGSAFLQTAKKELAEQFTLRGFGSLIRARQWLCVTLRGLGIAGGYYNQYTIWSDDTKTLPQKLLASGAGLILDIFAAKGASLSCFPAGTKVHTQNGLADIEKLRVGDMVLTFNEEMKELEYKPIVAVHQRHTLQMLSLELPTGETLDVTPEHRFYSNGEWIEAGDLREGDTLQLRSGIFTTITSIETLPRVQKVYNFDVADNENYYVSRDGILVHNGYSTYRNNGAMIDDASLESGFKHIDDIELNGAGAVKYSGKGIVGCHNHNKFMKQTVGEGGRIEIIKIEDTNVPGVKNVTYKVRTVDKRGDLVEPPEFVGQNGGKIQQKTTYDPDIYSDDTMKDLGYDAFKDAMDNNNFYPDQARTFRGVADGKVISGHYKVVNGEKVISSWWFEATPI